MHPRHPATALFISNAGEHYESSVRFNNFTDGDTHCQIDDTAYIKGADIVIKHYLYPNQNEQLTRLLFLTNTLVDLGAKSIHVFTPYLPYARQDKAHLPGEAISSAILCRLLRLSGVTSMYTIDCHFMKGKLETTIEGLKIHNILIQYRLIERLEALTSDTYHIIGPDDGSSYLARGETMKKSRAQVYDTTSDGALIRDVATLDAEHLKISDTTLVVADDMVSTGSTMIKALESLKDRGIPNLYAMTSHGLFLKGCYEKIEATTKAIIYSDTITRDGSVNVVDDVFHEITEKY